MNGHISDLDWYDFVHRGQSSCKRQLWMDERGTSGNLADIFARCECGQSRSLAEAAEIDKRPLGYCKGLRPWLGAASQEKCGGDQGTPEINRLLVRSASNAYFPQVLSVISIPDREGQLQKAVDPIWEDFLQYAETVDDLRKERKKAKVSRTWQQHVAEPEPRFKISPHILVNLAVGQLVGWCQSNERKEIGESSARLLGDTLKYPA